MDRKHKKQRSLKLIQRIILSNKLMGGGNKKKNRKDCEYIKEQLEEVSAQHMMEQTLLRYIMISLLAYRGT